MRPVSMMRWSGEDCDYVCANYGLVPVAEMATHLKRSKVAVYQKAVAMDCQIQRELKNLSLKRYGVVLQEELAQCLPHSREFIHRRWTAWARLRNMGYSTASIGRCGGVHHAAVIYGSRRAGFGAVR